MQRRRLAAAIAFVAALAVLATTTMFAPHPAHAQAVDSDGDGVNDDIDIDDDSDGILDVNELVPNYDYFFNGEQTTARTVSAAKSEFPTHEVTLTADQDITLIEPDGFPNGDAFPSYTQLPVAKAAAVQFSTPTTTTVAFNPTQAHAMLVLSNIGGGANAGGTTYSETITFDQDAVVVFSANVTQNSASSYTSSGDGLLIVEFTDYFASIEFTIATAGATNIVAATGVLYGGALPDDDRDGVPNQLDADSDNDGITDNVEAQTTAGYIAPTGNDDDNDGLDNAYDSDSNEGLVPVNTDRTGYPDFLDIDSDDLGDRDGLERRDGKELYGESFDPDADNDGLSDKFENGTINDRYAVADHNRTETTINIAGDPDLLADGSNAVPFETDLYFRDNESEGYDFSKDTDGDGRRNADDPNPGTATATDDQLTIEAGNTLDIDVDVLANDEFVGETEDYALLAPYTGTRPLDLKKVPINSATGSDLELRRSNSSPGINAVPSTTSAMLNIQFAQEGEQWFEYEVCKRLTEVCATARLNVTVTAEELPPPPPPPSNPARADEVTGTVGQPVTIDVLANDDIEPGAGVEIFFPGDPAASAAGTAKADPMTGIVTYTPAEDETGTVTLAYVVCKNPVCGNAMITINFEPDAAGHTVSGRVYLDINRNGYIDDGEGDVSGVAVNLYTAGPDGAWATADDELVDTAVTASPYTFENVTPGTYRLAVNAATLPTGMYFTDDVDGGADQSTIIEVTGDTSAAMFGQNYLRLTGILRDAQGDPVPNTAVSLTDTAGTTLTDTTDNDGRFAFEGSAAEPMVLGRVIVASTLPTGERLEASIDAMAGVRPATAAAVVQLQPTAPTTLAFTGLGAGRLAVLGSLLLLLGAFLFEIRRQYRLAPQSMR